MDRLLLVLPDVHRGLSGVSPLTQGRGVALRVEPLQVSPLSGGRPSREHGQAGVPAEITKGVWVGLL